MRDLFVMMHDDARVWRLASYDDRVLVLELPERVGTVRAAKELCRVGTARNWQESRSFKSAWHAGGGENFV